MEISKPYRACLLYTSTAVFVEVLGDKFRFEQPSKLQIFFIGGGELLFADNGSQGTGVHHFCIRSEKLAGERGVVSTGKAFALSLIHI